MTEYVIAEIEREGYDVSSIRAKQTATANQEAAKEAAFLKRRKATAIPTDLNKLALYCQTPRRTDSDFFKELAGKAPLFGKGKWREVCQCTSYLWSSGASQQ